MGTLRQNAAILACQVALAVVFLAAWQFATAHAAVSTFLFGSPSAIWDSVRSTVEDGSLARDVGVTALETFLGFLIGNVVGMVIGLLLWYSRFIARVIEPFVLALGSIPIIALAPVVIIWLGTGLASKVAMSTLSVVVVALVTAYKGATSVDADYLTLLRALGASKNQIFRKLIIPVAMTDIFAGLRLSVGFALVGAIVGEFISSSEGLGHAIFKAGSLYMISAVFAALLVTIALALCMTAIVGRLERMLMPWSEPR
ncbi:MAG TPA: ABC transporter permease [Candidatus Limnocylindria bacterium]|jgi:NitT/TauT family transport system permease protein|nr:ABC transporter permease [Candidatus Limnocylindria bacterium]